MSKRNKKKLKKLRHQAMQGQISQDENVVATASSVSETGETVILKTEPKTQVSSITDEESHHVKKEIRKILLTMLVLVVVIVGISIVNTKTDFILKMGVFAADKLNIKI